MTTMHVTRRLRLSTRYLPLLTLLLPLLLTLIGTAAWGAGAAAPTTGFIPPIWSMLPFAGILLSIALFPLISHHLWEHHYGKVSFFWLILGVTAMVSSLPEGFGFIDIYGHRLFVTLEEYISFIVLLGSLFIISGGIHIDQDAPASAFNNTMTLLVGTLLASVIGTTGAAMLLIRPLLRDNDARKYKLHVVLFFIFLVCNIGGSLTPIGDPPLFLGFLQGVPFSWTLNLFPAWLVASVILLGVFYCLDSYLIKKETPQAIEAHAVKKPKMFSAEQGLVMVDMQLRLRIHMKGGLNFVLLGGVVLAVILSGVWQLPHLPFFGIGEIATSSLFRDIVLIVLALISLKTTAPSIRESNEFNYEPIREVALLFIGIFVCMMPALMLLNARGGELGLTSAAQFFWFTGLLSAFLDNAPTYLAFLATAMGSMGISTAFEMTQNADSELTLLAISVGAVFFGALTYIGNGPNFMVRAIAVQQGIKMPSFFGYFGYASLILLPVFVLISLLFF